MDRKILAILIIFMWALILWLVLAPFATSATATDPTPIPTATLDGHWINPEPWPVEHPTPESYPAPLPTLEPESYPEASFLPEPEPDKPFYLAEKGPDKGLWAWIWDLFTN